MRNKIVLTFIILSAPLFSAQEKENIPFAWNAGTFLEKNGDRVAAAVGDLPAVRFAPDDKTSVDLSASPFWNELTGPLTIRVVFRPEKVREWKMPVLSRWHMKPGGRSFELGVMPDGRPFFDVSASGNWDRDACELTGWTRLVPGEPVACAAVFKPGVLMALYVNGQLCGAVRRNVPKKFHVNSTPVLLGAQPPGQRRLDASVAKLFVDRKALSEAGLLKWSASFGFKKLSSPIAPCVRNNTVDLAFVRKAVLQYCRSLQVEGKPFGALRRRALPKSPVTLYASCDVAWIRACMGEDLQRTLTEKQRKEWIDHINSFAASDGTYPGGRHSLEHANGMVIGALAVLGGRQQYPVSLYEKFDEPDEIAPWLEKIRWERQWGASHLFWGGMHCYSMSKHCSDAWRTKVFDWLDRNLDEKTGWWRKGVPQAVNRIEVLGGAAHIWPVYQHHSRPFPYPKQVIDSILSLQKPDGSWINFSNYMELDALYGLAYMKSLAPDYHTKAIASAVGNHAALVRENLRSFLSGAPDAHILLSVVSTLALLQQFDPEHFTDTARWSDIFSDRRFYRTDRVER